jgi:2,3-bisphosphoglycerate-independent phosphoglycerate mutase
MRESDWSSDVCSSDLKKLHLFGLCSDIGVHSLLGHLYGLLEMCKRNGLKDVYLHAFTDGRDSPPTSGAGYIADIEKKMAEIGVGKIATVMGRFYAMDRDKRWERVEVAYKCLTEGTGHAAKSVLSAMQESYAKTSDESLSRLCCQCAGKPIASSRMATA